MNNENKLFKDRINKTNYSALINELSTALDKGSADLKKLLLGTDTPDLYANHGSFQSGQHNCCDGFDNDTYDENRMCKCLYYLNSTHSKSCDKCMLKNRFDITGEYRIIDYEVPAFYYGDGIGEIDLLISDGHDCYATEIKRCISGNNETLLRMIAEIMTYTVGYPEGKYKKAIAFFEKYRDGGMRTIQQEEYDKADPSLLDLLKKAEITVFRFEEVSDKAYRICRL